jgi:hypothetical protein
MHGVLMSRLKCGIGPRFYSLFGLADVPQERWQDYLLDERLRLILRRASPSEARALATDKVAFHGHCVENGIATVPIVAIVDRKATDNSAPGWTLVVRTANEFEARVDGQHERLFVKLIDGSGGEDAFTAEHAGVRWQFCGRAGSAGELFDFTMERLRGRRGWIFQPLVRPHPALDAISTACALPTIRAVTCLIDGQTRLLFAVLRVPVGRNVTDNFSHGASGNLLAPIDLRSGVLGVCRGSRSTTWPDVTDVPMHPDTGQRIEGFVLPMWDKVVDLLDRGQRSVPRLRTLGWDIAPTEAGPLVVEANTTYDVDLIQVAHKRGVGPDLLPLVT